MHPHYYTLSILKHLLDKSEHTLFPAERLSALKAEYEKLTSNPAASLETIEKSIAAFGREIWPYHEALEELYFRHGKKKEEERVREKLTAETRQKYEQFLSAGGNLSDFRHGADIEVYFTPEEKYEIGQAVLDAHTTTLQEIAGSCRADKKNECEEVIADHKQKLFRIDQKLTVLKDMAARSDKWRAEILDKVHTFEKAFGYLEKTFHEEDLNGAIDYYLGVLDLSEGELP
ncbi:hypothetical protein A3B21_03915 [Candidatus Uhrbacteria bacterium RIFCSPLOWO2_01_FULL_47_24]|uniref:Uncharacterized protein n=1 Tax=Candidatus Uhrbacteria bacterium RIFCSPLOWO2_01_FULL_47_24 TaxID=1802401 RepID=A0A1F7UUU0_9BACT|nr:MAG: hypothetical protein A2753_00660 [Candidatus Uhrbacteria bacterium RIFCSPHIGHO2_01_FULL_47_11]OGL69117.1 MAG: hypothetical protein A3D58_02615 [Candidatus Uhrbacteria bacterium RIFCSPHIGHO2_02_FULL_46_47]OGL75728.1 MAG: hypothetical protein A3F52_02340 [Candidatus Uhrbacteria bacterium RIFCSPHIGHO2_12_FULL_47_11]OGL81488.1 MAG: hypothetical protein A3B21_03915 [Candidatus Uhrbacteria bacterium RIFCSPLOWO2_01_FULL_47_24]OGL83733.1 MAG: hypothetical protein A3J03_01370 [Candidatus Uhrbact